MKVREPHVAGRFYPDSASEIRDQITNILAAEKDSIDYSLSDCNILGAVVPHAGYMFSAYQAIHFFEILKNSALQFDTFVIVNPNHTGYGPPIALDESEDWKTPLGHAKIDRDFYPLLEFPESGNAHKYEHSGEVMVPLLQYFIEYQFKILPVTLSVQNPKNSTIIAKRIL
ncbi:MAG: AmmeMemoRadiSam system protein B, partial [Bacteroidales bacterium]|nr:AmmeMemoRadiSam system protein B [Bacteroidales bacterium]